MSLDDIIKLCSLRSTNIQGINVDSDLVARQGVAGWIYKLHPQLRTPQLKQKVYSVFVINQRNIAICNKIQSALSAEGISMALLKGAALMTEQYTDISLRPIGDIDIWVKHDDVYRARNILKGISSYSNWYETKTNVLQESIKTHLPMLVIDGQQIELHYNLYSPDSYLNPSEPILEHLQIDGKFTIPDDVMLLYHLTTHILKNRQMEGNRMGWFVDIIMLFEKWGAEKAAQICKAALSLNNHVAAEMLLIWRYVVSLNSVTLSNQLCSLLNITELPFSQSILKSKGEYKKNRIKTISCLLSAIKSALAEQKGLKFKIQMMVDICSDILNRNKFYK